MKEKGNFLKLIKYFFVIGSICMIFLIIFSSRAEKSYALDTSTTASDTKANECLNLTSAQKDKLIESIINGSKRLTYECFGAKGDGKTNDYNAIYLTHQFANSIYINYGANVTVYATKGNNAYYIGKGNTITSGTSTTTLSIPVITNVDWRGASFIIDDYVLDGNTNTIATSTSVFLITSPMKVATMNSNGSGGSSYITYSKNDTAVLKSIGTLTTSSTNVNGFVTAVLNDLNNKIASSSGSNKTKYENMKKYYLSSSKWQVYIQNNNKMWNRSNSDGTGSFHGATESQNVSCTESAIGKCQEESFLVDSTNGNILSTIDWNYNNILSIRVVPIPENGITINNGSFTTWTSNVAGNSAYVHRNIYINNTGNVTISNVYHYLNETKHKNANATKENKDYTDHSNSYYGFIRGMDVSYIKLVNVRVSSHTPRGSSYDLTFDRSINVFFDKVTYPCNIKNSDGSVNWNQCYKNNIIDSSKWGVMATNHVKNLFIKNSTLNRVDSHRGVTNLYVSDSTIGDKGFTLTGKGRFYAKNVKMDRSWAIVRLRPDYGSTWDGSIVLNGVDYIIDDDISVNPYLIYSRNYQTWDYGYKTYFPQLYANNIKFDLSYVKKSSKQITLMGLSADVPTTLNNSCKYSFKGSTRMQKLQIVNKKSSLKDLTFTLFTNKFVNNNNNLSLKKYGDSDTVNVGYYNYDRALVRVPTGTNNSKLSNQSINTKFTFSTSSHIGTLVDSAVSNTESYFSSLEKKSIFNATTKDDVYLKSINLSSGQINETISNNKFIYTATVGSSVKTINLSVTTTDNVYRTIINNQYNLNYGNNSIHFYVIGMYGTRKEYVLNITRSVDDLVTVKSNSGYILGNDYLYTKTNTQQNQIISNLNYNKDISLSVKNGNLVLTNNNVAIKNLRLLNFNSQYAINGKNIFVDNSISSSEFLSKFTANGVTFQLSNTESNNIVNNSVLNILYQGNVIDSYKIGVRNLNIKDVNVDYERGVIEYRDSTYDSLYNYVVTPSNINILGDDNQQVLLDSPSRTGDKINIMFDEPVVFAISRIGDIDGNGVVDTQDLVKYRNLLKNTTLIEENTAKYYAADIDRDGTISINDENILKKYLDGEIDTLYYR